MIKTPNIPAKIDNTFFTSNRSAELEASTDYNNCTLLLWQSFFLIKKLFEQILN